MNSQKKCIKQIVLTILVVAALNIVIVFTFTVYEPTVALAANNDADKNDEIYYGSFAGGGLVSSEKETFTYARKTTESYFINQSFPNYFNATGDLKNTCANIGGANIIGYYDRFFTNLIPDCEPGYYTTRYHYYPMGKNINEVLSLIRTLYAKMETNVDGPGSTQTQYENGLASFVKSKGWTLTYSSVMSDGKLDLDKVKEQFKKGNPITLFLEDFNFTDVIDDGKTVIWDKLLYNDNHIAVAYGYVKEVYYDNNGKAIKNAVYLYTASGMPSVSGQYIVGLYGDIVDAEGVHIA